MVGGHRQRRRCLWGPLDINLPVAQALRLQYGTALDPCIGSMGQQAKDSPKNDVGRERVLAVAAGAVGTRDHPNILAIDRRHEMHVIGKSAALPHSLAILQMNQSADSQSPMLNQHVAVTLDVLLYAKIDGCISLGIR